MEEKTRLKQFLTPLYLFQGLYNFMPIYAFFYLYMNARGITTDKISILLVIWFSTNLVFKIPAGSLADKIKRKYVLAVSELFFAATFAIWMLYPNFWGFAAGFVCWGLRDSLNVGLQPLIFGQLQSLKSEDQFSKIYGRCIAISQFGLMLSLLLGPFIYNLGYKTLLLVAVAVSLVDSAIGLFIPEEASQTRTTESYWQATKKGLKETFSNAKLLKIIFVVGLFSALLGVLEEQVVLYSHDTGWSDKSIPIILAVKAIILGVASWIAHDWRKAKLRSMNLLFFAGGLLLVIGGELKNMASVVLVIGFFAIVRLLSVIGESKIQDNIKVDERATITGAYGFISGAQGVGVQIVFGVLAAHWLRVGALTGYGIGIIFACFVAMALLQTRHLKIVTS